MIVVHSVDLLAQLCEFDLRLGCTMCMVEDIDQLTDNASEAVHKTRILAFQRRNGLLVLPGLFSSRFSPRFLSLRPLPPSRGGKDGMGGRSTAWALHRPAPPPSPSPSHRGREKTDRRGSEN